jgi:hypothetical protein
VRAVILKIFNFHFATIFDQFEGMPEKIGNFGFKIHKTVHFLPKKFLRDVILKIFQVI